MDIPPKHLSTTWTRDFMQPVERTFLGLSQDIPPRYLGTTWSASPGLTTNMPWYKLFVEQTVLGLSQDLPRNTSNWTGDSMLLAISGTLASCARATWDIRPTVQLTSLMLNVQRTILGLFWEIPMQLVCFLGYSSVLPLAYYFP